MTYYISLTLSVIVYNNHSIKNIDWLVVFSTGFPEEVKHDVAQSKLYRSRAAMEVATKASCRLTLSVVQHYQDICSVLV